MFNKLKISNTHTHSQPWGKVPLWSGVDMGYQTPGKLFSGSLDYLSTKGISLYDIIHTREYSKEDLKVLVMTIFNLEDFFGDFVGNSSSDVNLATPVYKFLLKCHGSKRVSKSQEISDRYNSYVKDGSALDLLNVFECSKERLPLFVNGTELEKVLVKWRLGINK